MRQPRLPPLVASLAWLSSGQTGVVSPADTAQVQLSVGTQAVVTAHFLHRYKHRPSLYTHTHTHTHTHTPTHTHLSPLSPPSLSPYTHTHLHFSRSLPWLHNKVTKAATRLLRTQHLPLMHMSKVLCLQRVPSSTLGASRTTVRVPLAMQ